MQTATSTVVIEREIDIAASPETVYSFLTDPAKLVRWMGRSVEADARVGGAMRIDYNGFDIARCEFTVLEPPHRVAFTWGWETLGSGTRPGEGSVVEVTLTPRDGGTHLRFVHSGLQEIEREPHGEGWDMFLGALVAQAEGAPAPDASPALTAGEELASRLNTALVGARELIEMYPTSRWGVIPAGEQRTVAAVAQHIVGHLTVVHMATAMAAGERPAMFDSPEDPTVPHNVTQGEQYRAISPDEVLAQLRTEGPAAVEAVKRLDDAGLERSQPVAFLGADITARALIERFVLGDIANHIADMRAAAAG
jgi:uncharacterized protein YndB with AHSA1/START domain